MVKKLMKQEFSSLCRTLSPMWLILLGVALLTRFVYLFETDTTVFKIVGYSSISALVLALVVCFVMTAVIGIVRFYRNLYSSEGYLTFTLPATHTEHLWAKLLSSMAVTGISVFVCLLSGIAAISFDFLIEIFRVIAYFWKMGHDVLGFHLPLYAVEFVLALIVSVAFGYLIWYTCITVGQMARKNRILAAFGVYFAYYMVNQVLGVALTLCAILLADTSFFRAISEWVENNPTTYLHTIMGIALAFALIGCLVCWLITRRLMKTKLNLE